MRFSKIVFLIAGIWGVLVLAPLYFIFDMIGQKDPPAITHPGFYYGFVTVALLWQIAFFYIAKDPVRLRPMMVPSVLEKFSYGAVVFTLYLQSRMHGSDLILAIVDCTFGLLFLLAFLRTPSLKV